MNSIPAQAEDSRNETTVPKLNEQRAIADFSRDTLSQYLHYHKGKLLAHELCAQVVAGDKSIDAELKKAGGGSAWIQGKLSAQGFHILKSDIEKLFEIHDPTYVWDGCQRANGIFDILNDDEGEIERIPKLLRLHQRFAHLVVMSPIHPFDVTPSELLSTVFGDDGLVFIDDEKTLKLDFGDSDFQELSEWTWSQPPVSFWPLPLAEDPDVEPAGSNFKNEASVSHWGFRCIECAVGESLGAFIDVVSSGCLPLIWAAALDETKVVLMVRVDAEDRESWDEAGRAIVAQLEGIGIVAAPVAFGSDIPLPGSFKAAELLYFNPSILEDSKIED